MKASTALLKEKREIIARQVVPAARVSTIIENTLVIRNIRSELHTGLTVKALSLALQRRVKLDGSAEVVY